MHIFGSNTPRSGGTLISNLLSMHPDVLITKDLFHFFRHIYKKYDPLNSKNLTLLVHELVIRIKYRNDIVLDPKKILEFLPYNKEVYHYSDVVKMFYNYVGYNFYHIHHKHKCYWLMSFFLDKKYLYRLN